MTLPSHNDDRYAPVSPLRLAPLPAQGWLITLADLTALLVAFFALMFSMGEIDAKRWSATESAIEAALDIGGGGKTPRDLAWRNIEMLDPANGLDLEYLARVVTQQIDELPALAGARVTVDSQRLVISLPQGLLFVSGRAKLEPHGKTALFALSGALAGLSNELEIVGHTDPQPVSGTRWPSNWELSLTRAAVVAHALRGVGYDRSIRISGAGSGRFEDVNPRLPLAARYTLARRVDIVVRRGAGDQND